MPNWCYNITFIYGDKKQLEEFWNVIEKEVLKEGKGLKENSWNNLWLGNIFLHFYNDEEVYDLGLMFRGSFIDSDEESLYFDKEKGFIQMRYETAWNPNVESWDTLLKDFFPKLKEVTQSEEPNEGIYVTNDYDKLFFDDEYYLDACVNDNYYNEYFKSEDDLVKFVNKEFNKDYKSVKEIENDEKWIKKIGKDGGYFFINRFEDYD